MRKSVYGLFALTVLTGFTLQVAAQETPLVATVEGFVRIVDGQKKTLGVSIKKNGKRWYRVPFHRIKTVYLIPEKSETWPEWAGRVAKRRELPRELAVYDPKVLKENGNGAGIDYGDLENLSKFLQPGKSYVRVMLLEEVMRR